MVAPIVNILLKYQSNKCLKTLFKDAQLESANPYHMGGSGQWGHFAGQTAF